MSGWPRNVGFGDESNWSEYIWKTFFSVKAYQCYQFIRDDHIHILDFSYESLGKILRNDTNFLPSWDLDDRLRAFENPTPLWTFVLRLQRLHGDNPDAIAAATSWAQWAAWYASAFSALSRSSSSSSASSCSRSKNEIHYLVSLKSTLMPAMSQFTVIWQAHLTLLLENFILNSIPPETQALIQRSRWNKAWFKSSEQF